MVFVLPSWCTRCSVAVRSRVELRVQWSQLTACCEGVEVSCGHAHHVRKVENETY